MYDWPQTRLDASVVDDCPQLLVTYHLPNRIQEGAELCIRERRARRNVARGWGRGSCLFLDQVQCPLYHVEGFLHLSKHITESLVIYLLVRLQRTQWIVLQTLLNLLKHPTVARITANVLLFTGLVVILSTTSIMNDYHWPQPAGVCFLKEIIIYSFK